jgi:hypothetical protein
MINNPTLLEAVQFLHFFGKNAENEELDIAWEVIDWTKDRFHFKYAKRDTYARLNFGNIKNPPLWIKTRPADIKLSRTNIKKLIGNKYKQFFKQLPEISSNAERPSIPIKSLKNRSDLKILFRTMEWFIKETKRSVPKDNYKKLFLK